MERLAGKPAMAPGEPPGRRFDTDTPHGPVHRVNSRCLRARSAQSSISEIPRSIRYAASKHSAPWIIMSTTSTTNRVAGERYTLRTIRVTSRWRWPRRRPCGRVRRTGDREGPASGGAFSMVMLYGAPVARGAVGSCVKPWGKLRSGKDLATLGGTCLLLPFPSKTPFLKLGRYATA